MPELLTRRQQQILDWFTAYSEEHCRPPTVRQVGEHFGIRSPNGVVCHLKPLCFKGYLEKTDWARAHCYRVKARSKAVVKRLPDGEVELCVPGRLRVVLLPLEAAILARDLAAARGLDRN